MSASPTEQPPLSTQTPAAARIYQEPTFRRQQLPKPDPALQLSALSSTVHDASRSTVQARQDSAIDQHRFDTANDAQLSKINLSHSHQSPKDDQFQPSPTLTSHQPAPPASTSASAPHQDDTFPRQVGTHPPTRQHSKSISSGASYFVPSPRPHDHSTERASLVDARNAIDSRPNITGPASLPEHSYGHQNSHGTRQQRYNVRFAANYTSENMPPSQKSRNDPPTPTAVPAVVAEPEQPTSSPAPVTTTEELPAPTANGNSRPAESQTRTTRDSRDRGEREPSVERCLGCNEAWRRPIPDMDSNKLSPAENNADYMRLASNMIERLRDQRKKADAAYDDWKWRHSHCYRPTSPYSTGSVDDVSRRTEAISHREPSSNGNTTSKRKSEVAHEPHSASKQRRVTSTSPAPPVRTPGSF